MLTASKLSTVAMLAMAAVLVQSPVSGVPMEQPAPVEEVATFAFKSQDFQGYEPQGSGQPSQQAIQDMLAIYSFLQPLASQQNVLPSSANQSSDDQSEQAMQHMNISQLKNAAQTSQRHYEWVKKRLPPLTQQLRTKLDHAWKELTGRTQNLKVEQWKLSQVFAAHSAWETTMKEVLGLRQLEDCPYDKIPYYKDKEFNKQSISEHELFDMATNPRNDLRPYVRSNVCRLAVNGGYYWLMKFLTLEEFNLVEDIFSVLGQLRLFSSDKALVQDLDHVLSLLANAPYEVRSRREIRDKSIYLLALVNPAVLRPFRRKYDDVLVPALLLLAAKHPRPRLVEGFEEDFEERKDIWLDNIKVGNIDNVALSLYRYSNIHDTFGSYMRSLINNNFHTFRYLNKLRSMAIDTVLDNVFKALNPEEDSLLNFVEEMDSNLRVIEVLVNALDLPQFINLYRRIPQDRRDLSLIIMAGRSRIGPDAMFHVFVDILGKPGTPIKDGVQVDGQPLNAGHLAELVRGCALACTEDNWKLFLDELLDKVKVTEHLPGGDDEKLDTVEIKEPLAESDDKVDSAQLLPAEKVARKITSLIENLRQRLASSDIFSQSRKQEAEKAVQKATARMDEAFEELDTSHYSKTNLKGAHRE